MLGAYIGDIVGSVYEWNNIKTKDFPFFQAGCEFTDDSVMTCAVAKAIRAYLVQNRGPNLSDLLVSEMQRLGRQYPNAGYGGMFAKWLVSTNPTPYNSFGNGSAMRVSAAGWYAESLEEALNLAEASAEVTHSHPEGIKGAKATAAAIFLARQGLDKSEIKSYIETAYYKLPYPLDEIRPDYRFNETCQETVPQAMVAFFESTDFEDAIRNAISLGGDSDTLAAITGSVAEAYYGIPPALRQEAMDFLDSELKSVLPGF